MRRPFRNRNIQRGAALLALLVIVVLTFAYVLTSRLHTAAGLTAVNRQHNAKVMSQAKQALIGWMVLNAAQTDNNPGRLPCPEAVNSINTSSEGVSAPQIALPGPPPVPATPNCATVGRLPWRTLGLDKLVDATSEPLWYAVSPGWALQNSSTFLTINSDSRGAMVVDGQAAPNEVVALIIAPGRAMNVAAAPGCAARNQMRAAPAPAMDPADYVECFTLPAPPGAPAFSTTGPATSFNDQLLTVTTAELIPALEAAIAQRMQREIAPVLRSVYGSAQWGTSATNPLFPFATPWSNPGTSNYQGADGRYRGLLPFNCSATGCAADARYAPTFVSLNTGVTPTASASGGLILGFSSSCSWQSASRVRCTGTYVAVGTITVRMAVRYNNVAMALRRLDNIDFSAATIEHGLLGCGSPVPGSGVSASFRSNGSADVAVEGQVPGLLGGPLLLPLSVNFCMTADFPPALDDHPILDRNHATTGWFVRNEWHRLVYYAVAAPNTADGLSGSPPTLSGCNLASENCLRFNDDNVYNIRALLVLAGRSLSNPAGRPNATLSDYLEYQNCDFDGSDCDPQTLYELRASRSSKVSIPAINAPWNDRMILVDWVAPNPTFPLAYKVVP